MREIDWPSLFKKLNSKSDNDLSRIVMLFIPHQPPVVKMRFYQILSGVELRKLAQTSRRGEQHMHEQYAEEALILLLYRPSAKHICDRLRNMLKLSYDRFSEAYKFGRGPHHTKKIFARFIYANDHGVCQLITFFWLLSTVSWLKASGLKLRDTFYELLSTFNAYLQANPQINDRDLVSSALIKHFQEPYLNKILQTPPTLAKEYDLGFLPFWVCGIFHTQMEYFEQAIFVLLKNMLMQNLEQISIDIELAQHYTSATAGHALGMSIEVRGSNMKILYFDPNDLKGGMKVYVTDLQVLGEGEKNKPLFLNPGYRDEFLIATFYCCTTDGQSIILKLPTAFYQPTISTPLSKELGITAINNILKRRMTKTPQIRTHILALLREIHLDVSTDLGVSAYFLNACIATDDEVSFKMFIQLKAVINARDFHGWSPLYLAVIKQNRRAVEICLENGADVNFECDNKTPLHSAKIGGNQEILNLLFEAGGCCSLQKKECVFNCPRFC